MTTTDQLNTDLAEINRRYELREIAKLMAAQLVTLEDATPQNVADDGG